MPAIDKVTSYNNAGTALAESIREDLSDIISNIDPADTPLFSMIASTVARSTTHEWLIDDLEAASATTAIEGAAFDHAVTRRPVRMSNYTAILRRDFEVTDTMRAVENAGMTDAFAYQLDKSMRELARNTEKALLSGAAAAGDNDSGPAARVMAGLATFVPSGAGADAYSNPLTNDSDHSVAVTGDSTGTLNDQLAEVDFNGLLETMWDAGAKPDTVLANAAGKRNITSFTAGSTVRRNLEGAGDTLRNSIMYYESDFGSLAIHLSRHNPAGTCFVFQRDLLAKAFLQPTAAEELARTTDSQPGTVKHELTLVCRNPDGIGEWTGVTVG